MLFSVLMQIDGLEVSKHILNYDFDNKINNNDIDVNDFATIYIKEKNKKNFLFFCFKVL